MPFYGYNRPGAKVSEGVRESFWLQGMMAGFPAAYFCIKAFSETDLTEDLKKFDVPTLILHGDDDQIVPIGAVGAAVVQAGQGRDAEGLQGRAARHVHDAQGPGQRGSAGVLESIASIDRHHRPIDPRSRLYSNLICMPIEALGPIDIGDGTPMANSVAPIDAKLRCELVLASTGRMPRRSLQDSTGIPSGRLVKLTRMA